MKTPHSAPAPHNEGEKFSAAPGPVAPPEQRERTEGGLGFLKELPVLILVAFAIALVVKTFVVQAFYIPSGSMENTLLINDRVLVSKFVYDFKDPKPGNIVVFVAPASALGGQAPAPGGVKGFFNSLRESLGLPSSQRDFIKRVVAVGGDTVQVKNLTLYVNGQARVEPYLHDHDPMSMPDYGPYKVPAGDLFVMGDNRGDSQDSRVFGAIPKSSVVGQAFLRIWPVSRFMIF